MMKVHLKTTKENGYYPNDGMTANSQTTGSDMQWQEFYLLNANGTFKNLEKRWICN
jgi:hypothetical protein